MVTASDCSVTRQAEMQRRPTCRQVQMRPMPGPTGAAVHPLKYGVGPAYRGTGGRRGPEHRRPSSLFEARREAEWQTLEAAQHLSRQIRPLASGTTVSINHHGLPHAHVCFLRRPVLYGRLGDRPGPPRKLSLEKPIRPTTEHRLGVGRGLRDHRQRQDGIHQRNPAAALRRQGVPENAGNLYVLELARDWQRMWTVGMGLDAGCLSSMSVRLEKGATQSELGNLEAIAVASLNCRCKESNMVGLEKGKGRGTESSEDKIA